MNTKTKALAVLWGTMALWVPTGSFGDGLTGFDVEGNSPYGPTPGTMVFSALGSKVLTGNGHGLRNEVKRTDSDRKSMADTAETLSATVGFDLSPGAKTIVVQYHEADTQTLLKLYVADIADRRLTNGVAGDGVFDVYARIDDPTGKEILVPFLALKVGERFSFVLNADGGTLTLSVEGRTVVQKTKDSPAVYLKFGDYLQAQDPVTDRQEPHDGIPTFYARHGITVDRVTFENVVYHRIR